MRLPTFFGSDFFKGLCFWKKEQKDVFESDLKESDLYIKKQLDAEEEKRKAEEEAEVSFDWDKTKESLRRFFARFRKKKSDTAAAAERQSPVSASSYPFWSKSITIIHVSRKKASPAKANSPPPHREMGCSHCSICLPTMPAAVSATLSSASPMRAPCSLDKSSTAPMASPSAMMGDTTCAV